MNDPLAPGPLAAADVRADWDPNGSCADLYQDAVWIGSLRLLDAWFTAGSRIPQKAWVVEWQVESRATVFERALVELGASSALDEERKADWQDAPAL